MHYHVFCFVVMGSVALTSTLGTTNRSEIFALSSSRLFQSSMSMVLEPQKKEDMISRALLMVDKTVKLYIQR